jgi:plastocyanin
MKPRRRTPDIHWTPRFIASRLVGAIVALLALSMIASCGSNPAAPSEADATITIGSAGVFPSEVRIKAWGHVRFVNNDSQPHSMVSDPIDVHTQCPPINLVGALQPGESRTTGTLNLSGTCGFHDHLNKSEPSLRGRIVVE